MSVFIDSVKTDRFEMGYFRFGTGEKTAVILPGLSIKSVVDSAESVAAAYRSMNDEYTVYVFDRRRVCPEGYTIADMANDTAEVFDALGIRDTYIFGASQGGMIAQLIALERPKLVRKVALCSTVGSMSPENSRVLEKWIRLAESRDIGSLNTSIAADVYSEQFFKRYGSLIARYMGEATEDELKRFIVLAKACRGFDVLDRLENIKCPVFVIGSKTDKVFNADDIVLLAKKANAELYLYDGFGHAVYDEAPDFLNRLLAFFKK